MGIVLGFAMIVGLMLVPLVGSEVNGARRWLNLGISLQPSEFLKPAFAIALAWILAWRVRDPNLPVIGITIGIMGLVGALLMLQPDFGSTILFAGVWFVLVLLSGLSVRRIVLAGATGVGAMVATYLLYDNARHRIDAFLGGGTAYDQVDLAERTLLSGGWGGAGLWLGTRKLSLPEAHTDYIFSVIGEEFGLWVCGAIVLLYLAVVVRVLLRLVEEDDLFTVLAATGLTAQLGGQAFINILVNLQLFPSKGMTLPLISYGGSSTVALCLGVGFLLAITRRNPFIKRDGLSPRDNASPRYSGAKK
jgi:cell division protein FtsW